jgi:hypothetical protein
MSAIAGSGITAGEIASAAINDFRQVATLARVGPVTINTEVLARPHVPPPFLPLDTMAVYAFFLDDQALKVGMVDRNSEARYTYQHYSPGAAPSTLAKSILARPEAVGAPDLHPSSVGDWIRINTDRVNFIIPASNGRPIAALLEAFLHVRWHPTFEGRSARP